MFTKEQRYAAHIVAIDDSIKDVNPLEQFIKLKLLTEDDTRKIMLVATVHFDRLFTSGLSDLERTSEAPKYAKFCMEMASNVVLLKEKQKKRGIKYTYDQY